jgi:hypothetical protein
MRSGTLHLHYKAHLRPRRHREVGFQKQASYAYIFAHGLQFADRSVRWEAETDRKLKIESAVPALLRRCVCVRRVFRGIFGGTHLRMLALQGTGEQVAKGHRKRRSRRTWTESPKYMGRSPKGQSASVMRRGALCKWYYLATFQALDGREMCNRPIR